MNFFFDLDGTLLPFGESIKDSAVEAIAKARQEGHRMFICTGRSRAELDPRLEKVTFDGGVFNAGGTVVLGGKEIYSSRYTEEEKNLVFDYLEREGFLPMVQTEEGTYMTTESFACFNNSLIAYNGTTIDVPGIIIRDPIPRDITVSKFLFFSPDGRAQKARKDLGSQFAIVDNTLGLPVEMMVEIVLAGQTKATGMEKILEVLGEPRESCVGLGDGANDMEMVAFSGLGIAMGNATDDLKAICNFVTGDCDKEGIAEAIAYATGVYLLKIVK